MSETPNTPADASSPEETSPPVPRNAPMPTGTGFGTPEDLASGPGDPGRPTRPGLVRMRKAAAVVLPVVLVLGAVGGAAFHIKATADNADTTVVTDRWGEQAKPGKDPAGDIDRGRDDTALSKLLLPVPGGHRLGPESDEYGNDVEMSGKEATALMKSAVTGLTGKDRRSFLKMIDRRGIQGVAFRSYASSYGDTVYRVSIVKMKDRRAIKEMHSFNIEVFDELPGIKKGPKIDGHKSAKCFMLPTEEKHGVDDAYCFAYAEDLLVRVVVSGAKPLSEDDIAWFVKDQLDHIDSPGTYV